MSWTVISPHLDDAVFSCGQWLIEHRHATVVTVFAGAPAEPIEATDWDLRCGFRNSSEAIEARRAEDQRALRLLDADAQWLPFLDSQYTTEVPALSAIATQLLDILQRRTMNRLLIPLGLFHTDHALAHEAALVALREMNVNTVLAYEDAIYRSFPGLVQQRLATLLSLNQRATPASEQAGVPSRRKHEAVRCYASQLRALGPRASADTDRAERIWSMQVDACAPIAI